MPTGSDQTEDKPNIKKAVRLSNKKIRAHANKAAKLDSKLKELDEGVFLKFLRKEVNGGKPLLVATFKEASSPEEARNMEINSLTVKYEKIHGKGSLVKALNNLPEAARYRTMHNNAKMPDLPPSLQIDNIKHIPPSLNKMNRDLKNDMLPASGNQAGGNSYKDTALAAVAGITGLVVAAKMVKQGAQLIGNLVFGSGKPKEPNDKVR